MESDAPLVTRTVAECHTGDLGVGDANKAAMYLLYVSEQPRFVKVTDRKTNQQEQVPVVSCLFGDFTGAIQGDLWRSVAEMYLPRLLEWSQRPDELVRIELSRFTAKAENRRTVQPTRKLVFSDASVFVRAEAPEALHAQVELSQDLLVHDFQFLRNQVPFLVNPCGYITNVSTLTYSRNGVPMLSFRLQDGSGKYVPCCAHGRHAENEGIEEKASVVIFFASASA